MSVATEVCKITPYFPGIFPEYLLSSKCQAFFSTFSRKLSCEKNSIFALRAKTQSHFCPKTQGRGSFYLIKICEKTQKMAQKLRYSLKTQHRGSLRLLMSAPQPLKKKACGKRYNASNQGQVVMLVNHCASLAVHLKWRYIFASLIASAVTFLILVCLWLNKVSIIIDL